MHSNNTGRDNPSIRRAWSRRGGLLGGCLAVLGVVVVLVIIGGVLLAMNWRSWVSTGMESVMNTVIDESGLAAEQAEPLKAEIQIVIDDFKNEQLTFEELGTIVNEVFTNSPVIAVGAVSGIQTAYIDSSGLTDEEKAAGKLALGRVARGVVEGQIDETELDPMIQQIGTVTRGSNGEFSFDLNDPSTVSDEQIKELIRLAQAKADAAEIPNEEYSVDLAAEFRASVDRALGREPQLGEGDAPEAPTMEAIDEGTDG
ncbi:MAG: hypothetical protein AAF747_08945 [Planctomycetota bacterium]